MSGVWGWVQSLLAALPRSAVTEIMRLSDEAPLRLLFEVAIVLIVLFLLFRNPYNPRSARLSKKEENALIDEWTPEPLLDSSAQRNAVKDEPAPVVESAADAVVKVGGEDVLSWAASNFLGFASAKELKEDAAKAIVKYGVGSCGPRGFYGTLDIHLQLEEVTSKFFGVTQSILYSDGLACLASVIPAFAKRDDLVVCDEGVNYAIQQGVQLSRSNVLTFKHNDMADLRRVLDSVREKDLKSGNTKLYRRFIVVEGLYQYHGDIAPLRDLIALKNEYRYRLVLDDSLALGVLGANGKGTYEHFGVDINEVDIMCGVFDHTMSSVGGWCIGREPSVVDHQRLAGAGYCFSASSPPYTSAAGIASFGLLSRGGAQLVAQLRERSARMHAALHAQLSDLGVITVNGVAAGKAAAAAASADAKDVKSSDATDAADGATAAALSPIIHLRLARPLDAKSRAADKRVVDSVVRHMRAAGIAVVAPKYSELKQPEPSVRVFVTVRHDNDQIDATAKALRAAFRNALSEVVAADEKELARLEESAAEAAASASPRGGAAGAAASAGAGKKGGASASSTAAAEQWLSDAHTKAALELTARLALLKPVLERVAETQIAHAFGGAAAAAAGAGAGARTGSRAKRSKAAAAAAAEQTDGKAAAADAEEAAAAVVASAPAKRSSSRVRAAVAEADGAAAAAAVTPIRTRSSSKGRAAAGAGSGKKKK